MLLDEWRGFHPYTTWSTTTFANAEALLAEAGETAVRLGAVRCYLTRHGPGPFVTEDPTLELPEPHNGTGTWQGAFRAGHPDAVAGVFEDVLGVPVMLRSYGPTAAAKRGLQATPVLPAVLPPGGSPQQSRQPRRSRLRRPDRSLCVITPYRG